MTALDLDLVLFAPVGIQPLKPLGPTASFEDRVAMTELAIKDVPGFVLCLADAPSPTGAPNYTIDTLLQLRNQYPAADLFMLMGADSLVSLPHWHRGAEVPFLAPLVVASRPGQHLEHLGENLPSGLSLGEDAGTKAESVEGVLHVFTLMNAAGASTKFYLLPGTEIEISATEVRHEVSAALDRLCEGHGVLPDAVCSYIAAHGLYR
jgi:nicotinate-nucleotide adenylyltransferase